MQRTWIFVGLTTFVFLELNSVTGWDSFDNSTRRLVETKQDCSVGGKPCESDKDCREDDCNQYACHPKHGKEKKTCKLHCSGTVGGLCHDTYPCCEALNLDCKQMVTGPSMCVLGVNNSNNSATKP